MPTPRVQAAAEGMPTVKVLTPQMTDAAFNRATIAAQPKRAKAFSDLEGPINSLCRMIEAVSLAVEDRWSHDGGRTSIDEKTFWTFDFLMGEAVTLARKLEEKWSDDHNAACTIEANSLTGAAL